MAITAYFQPKSMTAEMYGEALGRLEAAGKGAPDGRLNHVSGGEGDQLWVLEVWESPEQFAAFGETLMPILDEIGIDVGEPMISPLQKQIIG
jgi:hypothetical protein